MANPEALERNIKLLHLTADVLNSLCIERSKMKYDQTQTADIAVYQMTLKLVLARMALEQGKLRTGGPYPGSPLHSTIKGLPYPPPPGGYMEYLNAINAASRMSQ